MNIPDELIVFILSMFPIVELRGALPLALEVYGMPIYKAFLLSVAGNIVPGILIVYLLEPVSNWMIKKSSFMFRFFTWLFTRTRSRFIKRHQVMGDIALILFVAVPLPVTGIWTGALAAWLFGIPPKRSLPLLFIGLLIAGVIVTLLTLGISSII